MTLSTHKLAFVGAAAAAMLVLPLAALAQTASTTLKVELSAAVITRAKDKADAEIDRRTKALQDLATRVEAMTKVTAEFKQNLTANVQAQINGLAALKTKIDADTDGATLRTDVQTIKTAYRIFALVMPQARIAAAADREATIINMLAGIGSKLQARIAGVAAAGGDTTALTATLTDMGNHLTSAQGHAQAAVTASATLTPDDGDATKMKANVDALTSARKEITAAHADLTAARKDIDTLLKGLHARASASASTTANTQ